MINKKKGLSQLAISGVKWTTFSQFSKQLIQYTTTFIFALLLSPKDFGVIAIAYMLIGFLDIFKDLGTSSAIIYLEESDEEVLSSIFWVNIIFGLFISTIIFFGSYYGSIFFNSTVLSDILKLLSVSFLISSFSIVQKSLFEKKFEFNKLAKIETFSVLIGAIAGISCAIFGMGVWSLVIQAITANIISTSSLWIFSNWKPKYLIKIEPLKKVLNYSLNLTGYNIFNYFVRNADYFLIGKYVGENALGHYYLAYKIMLYPLQNISRVLSRVMFPVYSKIQNDNIKFRKIFTETSKLIAIIAFPIMIIILGFSKEITDLFFSSKWDTLLLAELLTILAPIGIIQSLATTTGSIYQAKGRTDWMFRWGIFSGIFYVGGFLIGLHWGVIGVALSYLVVTFLLTYLVFAIPFKLIHYEFWQYFLRMLKIITINISLLLVLFVLKILFYQFLQNEIIVFGLSILIGIILYVFTIVKQEKKVVGFLIHSFIK